MAGIQIVTVFCSSFDREDERYYFSVAQPYSLSRYNLYMSSFLDAQLDYFKVEKIGQTIQERPLELLTITDPANLDPVKLCDESLIFIKSKEDKIHSSSTF